MIYIWDGDFHSRISGIRFAESSLLVDDVIAVLRAADPSGHLIGWAESIGWTDGDVQSEPLSSLVIPADFISTSTRQTPGRRASSRWCRLSGAVRSQLLSGWAPSDDTELLRITEGAS